MSDQFLDSLQVIEGEAQQKNESAYQRLRQAISDGTLQPGARLVQRELATKMGVSQMPVRDALLRLANEGLVEVIPYVGAVVTELTTQDVRETIVIRGHLEALATRMTLPFLSRNTFDQLEVIIAEMEEACAAQDPVWFGRLNETFHRTSYSSCPSKRLLKMIDDLWLLGNQEKSKLKLWLTQEQLQESLAEHKHIVELLRSGTPEETEAYVRWHKVGKSAIYPVQQGRS